MGGLLVLGAQRTVSMGSFFPGTVGLFGLPDEVPVVRREGSQAVNKTVDTNSEASSLAARYENGVAEMV